MKWNVIRIVRSATRTQNLASGRGHSGDDKQIRTHSFRYGTRYLFKFPSRVSIGSSPCMIACKTLSRRRSTSVRWVLWVMRMRPKKIIFYKICRRWSMSMMMTLCVRAKCSAMLRTLFRIGRRTLEGFRCLFCPRHVWSLVSIGRLPSSWLFAVVIHHFNCSDMWSRIGTKQQQNI